MSRVTVVAAKAFDHGGRTFVVGDAVEVDALQAAALARRGYVTLDRSARPRYQTRDMVAEPALQTVTREHTVTETDDLPFKRPRRSYKRQKKSDD